MKRTWTHPAHDHFRQLLAAVTILGLCLLPVHAAVSADALADLYANHQWFELRDAVPSATDAPARYRAAVACGFHTATCEREVQTTLAAGAPPDQEYELREHLNSFHFRAGRYRSALAEVERMATIRPDAADVRNALPLLRALARRADQTVVTRASSSVAVRVSNENFPVPMTINGRRADFFFDTGANLSVMTESEATRLGVTVHDVSTQVFNTPGTAVGVRVATADDLVVGGFRLKNVAFLVFRDDQQPFSELPPGHRGAIGVPVLLAFGTFSWGADNQFRIGPVGAPRASANLCFDGLMPVVRMWRQSTPLSFNLDTGAEETMLWPPFSREFADVMASGKKAATSVAGVGATVEAESVELPRVEFTLGGQPVRLAPVSVLLRPTTADTKRRFGNVGLDLLNQARRTIISFDSMTLTLEGRRPQ